MGSPLAKAERPPTTRWPLRRVHKWLSVAIGLVLVMWVVSGLIMIVPRAGEDAYPEPQVDLPAMTASPAQAAATAGDTRGGRSAIRVQMRRLGTRLIYVVSFQGEAPVLVDAGTRAIVTITPELAGLIATEGMPEGTRVADVALIERPTATYDGPLPAYRVAIADGGGTVAYVHSRSGERLRNDRANRIRGFLTSFHTFGPLGALPRGGAKVRDAALWIAGIITLAVAATGYWMAWPRRNRRGS